LISLAASIGGRLGLIAIPAPRRIDSVRDFLSFLWCSAVSLTGFSPPDACTNGLTKAYDSEVDSIERGISVVANQRS